MAGRQKKSKYAGRSSVRVGGEDLPILDTLEVHRRTYFLLKELSQAGRQRYLGFDPAAGPGANSVRSSSFRIPAQASGMPK